MYRNINKYFVNFLLMAKRGCQLNATASFNSYLFVSIFALKQRGKGAALLGAKLLIAALLHNFALFKDNHPIHVPDG